MTKKEIKSKVKEYKKFVKLLNKKLLNLKFEKNAISIEWLKNFINEITNLNVHLIHNLF